MDTGEWEWVHCLIMPILICIWISCLDFHSFITFYLWLPVTYLLFHYLPLFIKVFLFETFCIRSFWTVFVLWVLERFFSPSICFQYLYIFVSFSLNMLNRLYAYNQRVYLWKWLIWLDINLWLERLTALNMEDYIGEIQQICRFIGFSNIYWEAFNESFHFISFHFWS